uniref:reverse transcriptase family protein n=1 Tax=Arthrobacter sp. H5 TaxID=1267973 RepID=UPI001C1DF684
RWLPRVVAGVLGFYHRPPRDAHRELAAVIELSDTFRAAVERSVEQRRPIRIAHYVVGPGHGAKHAVLPLNDLADLTRLLGLTPDQLDWFSDTRHWNRRASSGSLQHYRYEWRARAGRVPRLLEVPRPRLREVQRKVLSLILSRLAVHDAAHGFVPGRSAATGARPHEGAKVLINLDLSTFFTRVTAGRVYGVLRQEGFPEAVAHTITGLCTHSVPPRLVTAAPSGGRLDERFVLRQALAVPHLPQGAPSSPMLANLAVRRLDRRLTGWAEAAGAVYTRYADDLAFSGGDDLTRRAGAFIRGVRRIVEDEGHFVNARKTRVSGWSVRQSVTGIVVNEHTNVTRSEFDRLKAVLHNCVLHGPGSQNRSGHHDFRSHLLGRIAWVAMLNPARGAKLRETFDRILW